MRVSMICHASILVESGSVALLTDPWFTGEVFNESWSLLCSPSLKSTELEAVTHIWISHEHPDHLHFPTLKNIPQSQKDKITLLYQEHFSPRVIEALKKLGFPRVVELPLGRWCNLGDDFEVLCHSVGTIDSLLAIRTKTGKILNMNDCMMNPTAARRVAREIGAVDLLFTQFSIANWAGNPDDAEVVDRKAVLDRARLYISTFKPKATVPFASFIYFSHEENRHMNNWINTPDLVHGRLSDQPSHVQFMFNGDSWSSESGFSLHGDPLERYRHEFESISDRTYRSHPSYSLDELTALGKELVNDVRGKFPKFLTRKVDPVHFYISDLQSAFLFDLRGGTVTVEQRLRTQCDMALSSQALWFAFKFPWGFSTLEVSGRYVRINPNVNKRALYFCHLSAADIHTKGLLRRLSQRRVWRFCWTKRHEVIGRLLGSVIVGEGLAQDQ